LWFLFERLRIQLMLWLSFSFLGSTTLAAAGPTAWKDFFGPLVLPSGPCFSKELGGNCL
jgi:hypothetical protein